MKTKTKQTILSDPHRLKEHIKRANLRAYYWQQYLKHDIKKVEPSRTAWLRDETIKTILVWIWMYECSQPPSSMKWKRKSQAKGREVDLIEQSKAIDERTRQLNAVVAKIQMDDISSDEEELEESDDNETKFASESDGSDFDF